MTTLDNRPTTALRVPEATTMRAVVQDRVFPLAQAPEAMTYLAAGNARGKIAITVG